MSSSLYQKAKGQGYSDDEIMDYLSKKDPTFSEKVKKAETQGYDRSQIIDFLGGSKQQKQIQKPSIVPKEVSEIPGQAVAGLAEGALGTYGDILDLFGAQPKGMLPGQQSQAEMEFNASPEQLAHLVETDEPAPRFGRISSGKDVGSLIQQLGGPGEAEGMVGRGARRAGRFVGGGLATGTPGLKAPIASAGTGQALEELGAPPWMQAAGEIIAFAKTSKSKTPLTSESPEIKNKMNELKKMGYSEDELTLAKNALEDRNFLKKSSKLTTNAEKKFTDVFANSEKRVQSILEESLPGIEKGTDSMKKASAELYDAVDEIAKNVKITKPEIFVKEATAAIENLKKTLANTPQEKQVIELFEKAIESSKGNPTADHFINFFQGMNQIGNWSSPKQREQVFATVKNAIKDTFKHQGPEGIKLADIFEKANVSWKKFRSAEDISDIISKASTDEGLNFIKLNKLLDNPNNMDKVISGVGTQAANKIKLVAKTGSDIGDLQKIMKGGLAKEALGIGKIYNIAKAFLTGDISSLKAVVGAETIGRISTKLLTDPKYQNIQLKMMDAIKKGKWDQVRVLAMNADKMLEEESKKGP